MKKRGIGEKPHLKKKKQDLVRVRLGRWGHKSTCQVDHDFSGCCTGQSFNKSEPVQLLGPGSTRQAGLDLITVVVTWLLPNGGYMMHWYTSDAH
jgi:hypothetical protein